jgi:hypothetical protein
VPIPEVVVTPSNAVRVKSQNRAGLMSVPST